MGLREDGDGYWFIAQTIQEGNYVDVTRGPLYPAFLAAVGSRMPVKVVQAILDTAVCVGIYFLARKNWWAALLWAVHPFAVWRAAFFNKEAILPLLLVGYVCAQAMALRKQTPASWLAAGGALAVLSYARPTFFAWPVLLAAVLWARRVPLRGIVYLVFALAVLIAPWVYRNYRVTKGDFVLVATEYGGEGVFVGNYQPSLGNWEGPQRHLWETARSEIWEKNAGASVVELDRAFYRAAWEHISANPVKAMELVLRKVGRFWFFSQAYRAPIASIALQALYLGLALIGLWRLRPWDNSHAVMLAMIGYVWALYALSIAHLRYSLTMMPFVCVFAAAAFKAGDRTAAHSSR
jgi:ABC-type multidrug transport system fused ATPase/permease subunit